MPIDASVSPSRLPQRIVEESENGSEGNFTIHPQDDSEDSLSAASLTAAANIITSGIQSSLSSLPSAELESLGDDQIDRENIYLKARVDDGIAEKRVK